MTEKFDINEEIAREKEAHMGIMDVQDEYIPLHEDEDNMSPHQGEPNWDADPGAAPAMCGLPNDGTAIPDACPPGEDDSDYNYEGIPTLKP